MHDIYVYKGTNVLKNRFDDIFEWAGEFRKINIEKSEHALKGLSVHYSDVFDIRKDLIYVLTKMHKEKWNESDEENIRLFCFYLTEIWKIHPFREGNTGTTMFFFYEYMDSLGISLDSSLLSDNAEYVRTALVAASFEMEGICERNYSYLEKIVTEAMIK